MDAATGFGDGVYTAITLGLGDLQDVRDLAGIDGGVDKCSGLYRGASIAGNVAGGTALGGDVAKKLLDLARQQSPAARALYTALQILARVQGDGAAGTTPRRPGMPPQGRPPITAPRKP